MNIFMIEEIFYDCDYHQEVKTEYGYFLNEEDAKKYMLENELEPYDYNYSDIFKEGYRVIEIEPYVG